VLHNLCVSQFLNHECEEHQDRALFHRLDNRCVAGVGIWISENIFTKLTLINFIIDVLVADDVVIWCEARGINRIFSSSLDSLIVTWSFRFQTNNEHTSVGSYGNSSRWDSNYDENSLSNDSRKKNIFYVISRDAIAPFWCKGLQLMMKLDARCVMGV
jgi:hypothetical protein